MIISTRQFTTSAVMIGPIASSAPSHPRLARSSSFRKSSKASFSPHIEHCLVVGVKQAAPDNSFKPKPHNSFNRIADHRQLLSCGKRTACFDVGDTPPEPFFPAHASE